MNLNNSNQEFDDKHIENIISQRLSRTDKKIKSNYLDDNNNDCLTAAIITIYKSSLWCIQSVYELFLKSLWQILLFSKEEEIHYDHKTINSVDIMSMNNSAGDNYPSSSTEKIYQELQHQHLSRRLPKSNSQHSRQIHSSKMNMLSNKSRVTVRSMSNQNINRAQSNHTPLTEQKNITNTLGSINSHIVVVPVSLSQCRIKTSNNDLTRNHFDLKQSENNNLREQLSDAFCRRLYDPLTFMNRGMCCGHCRPSFFPSVPFHHSGHYFPSPMPQQELNKEREISQKSKQSTQMGDASETVSTRYSVSPSIQSHVIDSQENESLSNEPLFYNETNEQNQSILSFPEHDTPLTQQSEELMDDDSQLKLDAQILVDDLIQNAQEKYQRILRMSIDQEPPNNTSDTSNQVVTNKPKSVLISEPSNTEKLSDDITLCQELCNQLNLSDSDQIAEIVRILASNAPHILKQEFSNKNPFINNSNKIKENENNLCSQLLLHPPFKPKRLIHLCPDGSIQVLSAVDDNSNENQKQKYRLNYSNSAITPSIQRNNILTNESSLALECETTTVDLQTNMNHMMFNESTSTQQSFFDHSMIYNNSVLSLQQKKTFFKSRRSLSKSKNETQLANSDQSKILSHDNPIVNINLDLNDETMTINSEEDENSLPEIFFKRIIAPENSINHSTETSNQYVINENDESLHNHRKIHQKSRHHRSRSYTNKIER